ncbi:DUF551 domain-containing protein [Citrobacter sp. Res13-Lact-LER2-35-b]|uniref:DUF551 domain-containing protein n=1 Tax=Citrobacter sp. Res13-Lact-LER2-35-b TaxID=2777957 RepID=UPI0018A88EAD|nr:DUF551 domain-containing protein [Citrobacter sp. Res13-Lact-LER2-35-b]
MKTNNHPAHGPVSLDRLHQIREILSKASAQSDGGNLGYAMDDAVKVIDSAIAAFGAEPVAWVSDNYAQNKGLIFGEKEKGAGPTFIAKYWDLEMFDGNQDWLSDAIENTKAKPLYTAPPAPVVPDEYRHLSELYHAQEKRLFKLAQRIKGPSFDKYAHSPSQAIDVLEAVIFGEGDDSCLAVMQSFGNSEQLDEVGSWNNHMNTPTAQAGNSPVIPDTWIPVSERMPLTPHENCLYEDVEVQVFAGDDVFIAHYAIGALPESWGAWVDTYADITHWRPLAAAPQQEVKNV